MKGMEMSINWVDYYFPMLDNLNGMEKLRLVRKLTDSLLKNDKTVNTPAVNAGQYAFSKLAGVWADDPEADMMERAIAEGRVSNKTRNLSSFDE